MFGILNRATSFGPIRCRRARLPAPRRTRPASDFWLEAAAGTFCCFRWRRKRVFGAFAGTRAALQRAAFHSSEQLALTAGQDETARIWDVSSGRCLRSFTRAEGARSLRCVLSGRTRRFDLRLEQRRVAAVCARVFLPRGLANLPDCSAGGAVGAAGAVRSRTGARKGGKRRGECAARAGAALCGGEPIRLCAGSGVSGHERGTGQRSGELRVFDPPGSGAISQLETRTSARRCMRRVRPGC